MVKVMNFIMYATIVFFAVCVLLSLYYRFKNYCKRNQQVRSEIWEDEEDAEL